LENRAGRLSNIDQQQRRVLPSVRLSPTWPLRAPVVERHQGHHQERCPHSRSNQTGGAACRCINSFFSRAIAGFPTRK
jgi:hypothetical protein